MHSYESMKEQYSSRVSQTIDSPIAVMDFWELGEVFAALFAVLLFGLILYSWQLMLVSIVLILGVGPIVRRRNPPGIFFHWPYKCLGMSLPGLINPGRARRYSD